MEGTKKNELPNMKTWESWKYEEDPAARKELIEHYLPLVHYVANRMSIGMPNYITQDDLSSYGIMGLMDAIEKFDIERGLQFETYANWRIRGAIIDGLRQGDWVPRSIREKAKKVEDAYQHLEQQLLRSASDLEISSYLDMSEDEFHHMLQEISITTVSSLEETINDDETETRLSLLVDERVKKPEEVVDEHYLKTSLTQAIDRLTEKERIVVSLYYYEDLSLSEIAEVLSLTPSRISQLHSKAILRLRGSLANDKNQLLNDR